VNGLKKAVVKGMGLAIPDKVVTNKDLESQLDTSDEWIVQRTGIHERRISSEEETTSYLATAAGREALERGGVAPEDLDLVIVGTVTGDFHFPSTSSLVQEALGAKNAGAYDVGAACAGFIYSLDTAAALLESGRASNALVIGVDTLTKVTDWSDRSTCVLFGDGAGAMLLQAEESTDRGVMQSVLKSDGSGANHITMDAGGTRHPAHSMEKHKANPYIHMAGKEVYRFAVHAMGDACCRLLEKAGLSPSDVDLFVPHQANLRIIKSAAERLHLPEEKVFINVHKYGNTSGGSIPIALYEAEQEGKLKPGMIVMTVGFGAGLVWGANLIRW
jgi:3-oxoacyl-[acyl-carrier-protein] synthase III